MNYLIVEPHPDDAMLSAHYLLQKLITQDDTAFLLSISLSTGNEQKRSSAEYAEHLGYQYLDYESIPQIYYDKALEMAKKYNDLEISQFNEKLLLDTYKYLYDDIYDHIYNKVLKAVKEVNPDMILTGYGLLHCTHVLTTDAVKKVCLDRYVPIKTWYDIPYHGMTLAQHIYRLKTKNELELDIKAIIEKAALFEKYYPSELYMLDKNPGIFKLRELWVGGK